MSKEISANSTDPHSRNTAKMADQLGNSPYGTDFLTEQALELIKFSEGSVSELGGFGYLDALGNVDISRAREVYVQCRMVQVLGLGHLFGLSNNQALAEYGINAILDLFYDKEYGGFFNAIDAEGKPSTEYKLAYDHVFVLLAACTAKTMGIARADELLRIIDEVLDSRYWDEEFQMLSNSWNIEFTRLDDYRGINANMHAVEAYAAAFDVTGNEKYRDRAYAISRNAIEGFAKKNQWFLPEHFDAQWNVDKNYNIDNPADPFCPFGVTIGHLFEWSRLLIHLKMQMAGTDKDVSWIDEAAASLYEVARKYGWAPDGGDGFVYTIDWEGAPVVKSRMFWVAAEAVMTAYALWVQTSDPKFLADYNAWWAYIDAHVLDRVNGSWFHELDSQQNVVAHTWSGKPDTYHAFNASVFPLYPLSTSFIQTAKEFRLSGN